MKITYQQLSDLEACKDQLELFHTLFGDEVIATRRLILEHTEKFNWEWAAENLLPPELFNDFWENTSAGREVLRKEGETLQKAHLLKRGEAFARSLNGGDMYKDYQRVIALLDRDHEAQLQPLLAEYRRQCAPVFADLLTRGEKG